MSDSNLYEIPNIAGSPLECNRCHYKFLGQEILNRGGEIKCPNCGYRVIRKTRPPVVRRVPAK